MSRVSRQEDRFDARYKAGGEFEKSTIFIM